MALGKACVDESVVGGGGACGDGGVGIGGDGGGGGSAYACVGV